MSVNLQEQYDKVYKYCYYKVKNRDVAEDITQETFLKYFDQNSYISHGKPLAYLYTIAKNLCIDYFRQRKTEQLDESLKSDFEIQSVLTTVVVRQAVESLPSELAEVVLLRYGSELAIKEIATVLDISRFAVYRKLNAAESELKKLLREEDFYE